MSLAARLFLEALRFDLEPESEVRRRAERALELGVGGFVVFGGRADRVAELIAEWRAAVPYRLWIASDLERGPGQQFQGLPELPPPAGLAACLDPEAAANDAGRITGRCARQMGVNLVLAPVLDLDVDPRNPIVGTRSFGARPDRVARLGRAWIEGCESEGTGSCAKHFPGHGRTVTDSHDELPIVDAGRSELAEDLEPFRQVAGNVCAVMTAHVAYPALGSPGPATLEPRLLADLLRSEIGFEGIVVTDALNMSGFTDSVARPGGGVGAAGGAEGALIAGCDLLLYPADLAASATALDLAAIEDARTGDRLEESLRRLDDVARRIDARVRLRTDGPDTGSRSDARRAERIAVSSIRLFGELPWRIRPVIPLRLETVWDDRVVPDRAPFGTAFAATLRELGWSVITGDDAADAGRESVPLLLVASTPQAWKGTASFTGAGRAALDAVHARSPGAWPIVFGHPRLLPEVSPDGAGMCAWATEGAMERAAALRLDTEVRRAGDRGSGASLA